VKDYGGSFDAIHASPPCHAYSTVTGRNRHNRRRYADLVTPTRDWLRAWDLPYVIENVPGAPLVNAIMLCGSSFGLDVRRHRLFESNVGIMALPCAHGLQTPRFRSLDSRMAGKLATVVGVHGHLNYPGEFALRCEAMGIDWMTNAELSQAIPPAYTEHIGHYLLAELTARATA
jgi:DNA (cytosine-5)-methyltransferase 1